MRPVGNPSRRPRPLPGTAALTITLAFVPAFAPAGLAAKKTSTNPEWVGQWQGDARIIVAWCDQERLPIDLKINPDGTVTGQVGDATLTRGQIKRNRGWIGRTLNIKTDYLITGDLNGPIVAAEGISRSAVKLPVNLKDGHLVGGLHTSGAAGGGKKRMKLSASGLTLRRAPGGGR